MVGAQDDDIISTADWLAELSERARAQGSAERADHLLLLAWQAYDGQEISLEAIRDDIAAQDHAGHAAALSSGPRRATR
jgi:hypothetical protein